MFFNLGAFIAGCTAGYFFCKAENQFTRYGENLVIQMLKTLRRGKGDRDEGFPSSDRFSRVRERRNWDSDFDPMGDDSGPDFQDPEGDQL